MYLCDIYSYSGPLFRCQVKTRYIDPVAMDFISSIAIVNVDFNALYEYGYSRVSFAYPHHIWCKW